MSDDDSKTEEATAQRRTKAHGEGQFAKVPEAGGIAALVAAFWLIYAFGGYAFEQLRLFAASCFGDLYALTRGDGSQILWRSSTLLIIICGPIMLAGFLSALVTGLAQSGLDVDFSRIGSKIGNSNFFSSLKNILNPFGRLPELATQIGRVVVIGWITYGVARDAYPGLVRAARTGLTQVATEVVDVLTRVATRVVLAFVVLAVTDYLISIFRTNKALRMTKQEVKDEHKQNEGDPRIKSQARARGRDRIKAAIAKMVKSADVIVTNPTHVAVALRYRPQDGVPIVTAKGYDDIAMHIRKIARENGIPILENKPLARGLAKKIKVGKPISQEFFSPVADILAYVYRLKGRLGVSPRGDDSRPSAR